MTENQLTERINELEAVILTKRQEFLDSLKPYEMEMARLVEEYQSHSPLKVGDEIEYSPHSSVPVGIVRIEKARCTTFPDRWEYEVKILSVGNGPQKDAVGRLIWVTINRWEKHKKVN